jgi:hypothetical protein
VWARPSYPGRGVVVRGLAEGEGVGLDAGIQEGGRKGVVADRVGLAEELVQPGVADGAVALVVEVGAMSRARGLSMSTRNRTAVPGAGGAMTRCRSRAQKR